MSAEEDEYHPWVRVGVDLWLLLLKHAESHQGYEPGWYFSDEEGNMHGPFSTLQTAAELLSQYGEHP